MTNKIITFGLISLSILFSCGNENKIDNENRIEISNLKDNIQDLQRDYSLSKDPNIAYKIIESYKKLISIDNSYYTDQTNYNPLVNIAAIHADLENHKEAVMYYTKFIDLGFNRDDIYLDRGKSKFYLNDYNGAIIDLNKYKNTASHDTNGYREVCLLLGISNLEINKMNNACVNFREASEYGSDEAWGYLNEYCN